MTTDLCEKLEACPFCGSDKLNEFLYHKLSGKDQEIIQCLSCFAEAPKHIWNRRQAIALLRREGMVVVPERKLLRAGWQPCAFCGEWLNGRLQWQLHECEAMLKVAKEEK